MKGYGYGIWIVYDQELFQPVIKHTGHFTVACFMEKEDALNLYVEIMDQMGNGVAGNGVAGNGVAGNGVTIDVHKNYEIYGKNMYEKDENNIYSWGYNGASSKWPMLHKICSKYDCNFSHIIHTSIQYAKHTHLLEPSYLEENMQINGSIRFVNICSENPKDWYVIL